MISLEIFFRYADYKPVPPPKTAVYKPVPPPKPKSYPSRTHSQPPSMNEGNYMNSGPSSHQPNGGGHYNNDYAQYSKGASNGNGNGQYSSSSYHSTPNGRLHEETDSNGFDSGQGSSLDREYNNAVNGNGGGGGGGGQYRYANPPMANGSGGGNSSQGQYYYNIPHQQQQQQQQQQHPPPPSNGGVLPPSPRKSGEGLDLTGNREYRGSAFELYKKPAQLQQSPYHPGGLQQHQL